MAAQEGIVRPVWAATGLVPALTVAAFVNHLNVIAWNPFLPFIAEAHGIGIAILWELPAFLLVLSAVLGLVIGPIADSYGYRPTMVLSLLAVAASSLATGLSTMLPLLILAALLGAIGRAAIMPVAQAVAAAVFPDDSAPPPSGQPDTEWRTSSRDIRNTTADADRRSRTVARGVRLGVRVSADGRPDLAADHGSGGIAKSRPRLVD